MLTYMLADVIKMKSITCFVMIVNATFLMLQSLGIRTVSVAAHLSVFCRTKSSPGKGDTSQREKHKLHAHKLKRMKIKPTTYHTCT